MKQQSKAKMFLADERACIEDDWFRSYHTFNSAGFFNQHKGALNNLYTLGDITLAPVKSFHTKVEESSIIFLLPVVGNVNYKNNEGIEALISAGSFHYTQVNNTIFTVSNAYENDLINFLQIGIKASINATHNSPKLLSFDLDDNRNSLVQVTTPFETSNGVATLPAVSIGKFQGRKEAVYKLKESNNTLFVFIIQGAFEVQGRLLHARDGLGLWDEPEEIELEALSNDAIVLMIESNSSVHHETHSTTLNSSVLNNNSLAVDMKNNC